MKNMNTRKELILINSNTIQYKLNSFLDQFENGKYKVDFCFQVAAGRGFKKDQLMVSIYEVGKWGVDTYFNVDTLEVVRASTQGKYDKEYTKEITNIALWLFMFHLEIIIKKSISDLENVYPADSEETKEEQLTTNEQPEQQANINTYTAYKRTFPTYNEAVQYCNNSDFDPDYIEEVVAHPTASINGSLKMDLQLFGTPEKIESKPFKKPFATYKDGVSKFGIGKHLELVYTLETTMADREPDAMYYTNIHKYEFNNLQSVLERFNLYQQLGYHNLQLWTEIRYKGETIIENGTSCQIEFMVNNSRLKQAAETEKENERFKHQLKNYESFIQHYKVKPTFEKYLHDQLTINKDADNLYWYEMVLRPLSPFCQPSNHVKYDGTQGRHGIIAYDRQLTDNELEEYELRKWKVGD